MIRYANGEIATEEELNAIARAFLCHTHGELERVMRAGDEKRRRRAAGGAK